MAHKHGKNSFDEKTTDKKAPRRNNINVFHSFPFDVNSIIVTSSCEYNTSFVSTLCVFIIATKSITMNEVPHESGYLDIFIEKEEKRRNVFFSLYSPSFV